MKLNRSFLLFALLCVLAIPAIAQKTEVQEPLVFDSVAQQQRFDELTRELRCLVCQNQNLADSDAPLAHDLRREVHELLMSGKSDEEIKEFLVARYGDFVLYRPPVQTNTYMLWIAPLLLFIAGGWALLVSVRKRAALLEAGKKKTTD